MFFYWWFADWPTFFVASYAWLTGLLQFFLISIHKQLTEHIKQLFYLLSYFITFLYLITNIFLINQRLFFLLFWLKFLHNLRFLLFFLSFIIYITCLVTVSFFSLKCSLHFVSLRAPVLRPIMSLAYYITTITLFLTNTSHNWLL